MQNAADGLRPVIADAAFVDAVVPVVSNVTAQPISTPDAIREELVAQITAPVRWIASIEYMAEAGVDRFIEIGPGAVLTGMIKRITSGGGT